MSVLLALLAQPVLACTPDQPCDEHVEVSVVVQRDAEEPSPELDEEDEEDDDGCTRHCRERDEGYLTLRADALGLRDHTAWGVGLRGHGRRDNWTVVEGRWTTDGQWMGRFGAGIDIFGRSAFDLGVGLIAGHVGDWQTEDNKRFAIGTELLVGWRPGRFLLEHRHMGGRRPEGRGIRTESHTLIGYRILPRLEVAADFASIDPGFSREGVLNRGEHGVGLVLGLRF